MKSCFSFLITLVLVPIFIFTVMLTVIMTTILNEKTYQTIFANTQISKQINDVIIQLSKDEVIENIGSSRSVLENDKVEKILSSFVSNLQLSSILADNLVGVVQYINGNSSEVNAVLAPKFSESDVDNLRKELKVFFVEYVKNLSKCAVEANFTQDIAANLLPDCAPVSADVDAGITKILNQTISYNDLKKTLTGQVPISDSNLAYLKDIRTGVSLLKTVITAGWAAIGILFMLIFLINIFGERKFAGYYFVISIVSAVFIAGFGALFQFLIYPNLHINGADLNLANQISIDAANSIALLLKNIGKEVTMLFYMTCYYWVGGLVVFAIIMFVLNLVLRRHRDSEDNITVAKNYYIPAYTASGVQQPSQSYSNSAPVYNAAQDAQQSHQMVKNNNPQQSAPELPQTGLHSDVNRGRIV